MNKFIIALSAVVLLFASCRKDTPEQPKTTFSVLSAPKLFKVIGGTQDVTLDKAPSSAYAAGVSQHAPRHQECHG